MAEHREGAVGWGGRTNDGSHRGQGCGGHYAIHGKQCVLWPGDNDFFTFLLNYQTDTILYRPD